MREFSPVCSLCSCSHLLCWVHHMLGQCVASTWLYVTIVFLAVHAQPVHACSVFILSAVGVHNLLSCRAHGVLDQCTACITLLCRLAAVNTVLALYILLYFDMTVVWDHTHCSSGVGQVMYLHVSILLGLTPKCCAPITADFKPLATSNQIICPVGPRYAQSQSGSISQHAWSEIGDMWTGSPVP